MLLSLCSKSFSFFFLLNSCFVQLHAFNICLKLLKNAGVKEKHVWFQFNQHNEALLGWSSGKWLGLGIPADSGADPGFFLRRGCTHLLLYFNTNKPHTFFFLQNTSCIRKPQVISGGGGVCTPCTLPLDPPLRLLGILGGGCATQFSKSWPYFIPKNIIFHTCFQISPLKSTLI